MIRMRLIRTSLANHDFLFHCYLCGRTHQTILVRRLPNRLDLPASANSRIFSYKSNAFGERGRADEPIARIARIICRKLVGQHGNLCRDRSDCGPRADFLDKRLRRPGDLQAVVSGQPCQLPQCDRRDCDSGSLTASANRVACLLREFCRLVRQPDQHMRIE